MLGLIQKVGSSGGGYPVADAVVEGSLAVWPAGYGWGEQGGGEDGGVCQGCGGGARKADGGQGEAGKGGVRGGRWHHGCVGHLAFGVAGVVIPPDLDYPSVQIRQRLQPVVYPLQNAFLSYKPTIFSRSIESA